MRISEIKGEAVIDLIADIIEPVANIATDPAMASIVSRETVADDVDAKEYAAARLKKYVPQLIRAHRSDVIDILAAVAGKERSEYEKDLTVMQLLADVTDIITDDEFVDFFASLVSQESSDTAFTSISTNGDAPLALA